MVSLPFLVCMVCCVAVWFGTAVDNREFLKPFTESLWEAGLLQHA